MKEQRPRSTRSALRYVAPAMGVAVLLIFGAVSSAGAATLGSMGASASTSCGSTGTFTSPSQCSYTTSGEDTFTVPEGVTTLHGDCLINGVTGSALYE